MLENPYLKPSFTPIPLSIDNKKDILLFSEREVSFLRGSLYQEIIPWLKGGYSADQIVDQLSGRIPAAEVYYTIMMLEKNGYLAEYLPSLSPDVAIFADHLHVDLSEADQNLDKTSITVRSLSRILSPEIVSAWIQSLESLHIQVNSPNLPVTCQVVIVDDYLDPALEAINEEALTQNQSWMVLKPVGTLIWLGPVFIPKRTGCWCCLAHRLRLNRPIEDYVRRKSGETLFWQPPLAVLSPTLQMGLSMAATEILKGILQGRYTHLEGNILTYDTITLETQRHALVRRAQCSACGDLKNQLHRLIRPVTLGHRPKIAASGGFRGIPPEETLAKYQHHISPLTGLVRGLHPRSPHPFIHSYIARHPFATWFDDLDTVRQTLAGRSAGKGKTNTQAQVSGLCEALERYSGLFQGEEPRHKASYQSLGSEEAIHPASCLNFSLTQYTHGLKESPRFKRSCQRVPALFDEAREIDWTPVWSLTHQKNRYLPTAYCYYNYPVPDPIDCWADSNGCAAGNSLEEAILQGFLELVERDAVAIWWYNRLVRPGVDLDFFSDPYIADLQQYYSSLHRSLWVLDLTHDLGIPVFAAISARQDREIADIIFGFGAHLDPSLALERALTELNQILPNVLGSHSDGKTAYPPMSDPLAIHWWTTATIDNQPYLRPALIQTHDYLKYASLDLLEDINYCLEILKKQNLEMLVLDQTRPDVGLRVAKVIVPGLRHWWQRLGPGRLYDVPVQMNWIQSPLSEEDLNPLPFWM